jgi:hypothetical protein
MNFETLTLEETETLEQLTGLSIDSLMDAGNPRGRVLKSFVWIINKRTDPNYSIEQAAKVTLKEAFALFNGDTDPKV